MAVLYFVVWRNYISEILGNRLYQELYSKRKSSIIKEFGSLKQMPLHEQNDFTVLLFTSHQSTKACQEISIFRIISHGVHLHNIPGIFLATPTLDADI